MSYAKEGVEMDTQRKGRPRRYNYSNLLDWLRENFRDIPEWRRDRILNEVAAACEQYYRHGREGNVDFETLFHNPKRAEQ